MMDAKRISPEEYQRLFPEPSLVYDSVPFSELNRSKCEDVHYVAFFDSEGRARLGVILGLRDGRLNAPFSAPFASIEAAKPQQLAHYVEALDALRRYGREAGAAVRLTLPPDIYSSGSSIAKQYLAALSAGGRLLYTDYLYALPLSPGMDVEACMIPQARRKYRASVKAGLECRRFDPADSAALAEAYRIVCINHRSKGYPVHMSLDNLAATIGRLVKGSIFIVSHQGENIAAAVNYHHPSGVVQGVYWGHIPEAAPLRPMNFLAARMAESFASDGERCFDLGPSSVDGIPDPGLCQFKESLGYTLHPKPTIIL